MEGEFSVVNPASRPLGQTAGRLCSPVPAGLLLSRAQASPSQLPNDDDGGPDRLLQVPGNLAATFLGMFLLGKIFIRYLPVRPAISISQSPIFF